MKDNFVNEKETVIEKFLRLPIVDNCETYDADKDGFPAVLQLADGVDIKLQIVILKRSYPLQVTQAIEKLKKLSNDVYGIIVAPFISEASAKLCEENKVGFFDMAGNCYFCAQSIYMCEKGNPNVNIERQQTKVLFRPSATVTSMILRELLKNVDISWKLKYLAQTVGCSIGQVSKVKQYLCEQRWAEMNGDGLKLIDSKALLDAWSSEYQRGCTKVINCYSLDTIPIFEEKLKWLRERNRIECYLTAFAGGVRYAPVVRYNRIHVIVRPEDIKEFMSIMGCKEVDSGANIVIMVAGEEMLIDTREINGYAVASPVQVYLDCMQLKGRGEELAEAVFLKEIDR